MYPILFKIGGLTIHTYGFFVATGFFAGILLAKKEAVRKGVNPDKIIDLIFFIFIASIVGSRLFYIITVPKIFIEDPVEIFRIWNGGLVFYGGFIAAFITVLVYIKKTDLSLWKTADILAPSIVIGQFFGRLGCFAAGCCYGKQCNLPWAVTFENPDSLAPLHNSLHPTQLYSAISNLVVFAVIMFFRKRKKIDGQLFWLYVALYASTRFVVEMFRGDFRGVNILGFLSVSQTIGVVFAFIAVIMLLNLSKRNKKDI